GDLLLPASVEWKGRLVALHLIGVVGDELDGGDGAPVTVRLRPVHRASRYVRLVGAIEIAKYRRRMWGGEQCAPGDDRERQDAKQERGGEQTSLKWCHTPCLLAIDTLDTMRRCFHSGVAVDCEHALC